MRVLFASAEVFPLAKTGGLADVSAALPAALATTGTDIRLLTPGYPEALDRAHAKQRPIQLGALTAEGGVSLIPARTPDTGLPIWLIDCPSLFDRSGGLYVDDDGCEWADNHERFALLSRVADRIAMDEAGLGWRPHVVHANDWHVGLVAALLAGRAGQRPGTVMTLHNIAFQGLFPASVFPGLGLPADMLSPDGIEFYGRLSFLKAGIRYADRLTTVSPTYASEILTPEFGCGMDGLLRGRSDVLEGIPNGIDTDVWNPEDPADINYPFCPHDFSGKAQCKAALQVEMGLEVDPAAPLIAFVSRLTAQKMADVLPTMMPWLVARGAQLVVVGRGDLGIEGALLTGAAAFPGRIGADTRYTETLAKRAFAGADIVLVPSRFEPCGLVQMYAMRYGAVPVARRTGGLADTVTDDKGFLFDEATLAALQGAIERALKRFGEPLSWRRMQRRAMVQDLSWRASAERYSSLYERLCGERSSELNLTETSPNVSATFGRRNAALDGHDFEHWLRTESAQNNASGKGQDQRCCAPSSASLDAEVRRKAALPAAKRTLLRPRKSASATAAENRGASRRRTSAQEACGHID